MSAVSGLCCVRRSTSLHNCISRLVVLFILWWWVYTGVALQPKSRSCPYNEGCKSSTAAGTTVITTTMDKEEEASVPPAPASPPPADFTDDRVTCTGTVRPLKENWQRWSSDHQESQKHNPFSQQDGGPPPGVPQRGQQGYGRPLEGSITERRGKDAHTHICREVEELCVAIRTIGRRAGGDGHRDAIVTVEFGKLFEHYVTVSNKLVGVLLRARKQGLVHFEGEMLWQGQDDRVVITLLQ